MPATKRSSRAKAPSAPHQAEAEGISATATAISASGRSTPKGLASTAGTPKSRKACRDPGRSASLANPATMNTAASSRRAINRTTSINISPLHLQYFTKGQKAFLISIETNLGDRADENAVPRELLVRARQRVGRYSRDVAGTSQRPRAAQRLPSARLALSCQVPHRWGIVVHRTIRHHNSLG